jgi:hypothetical protein
MKYYQGVNFMPIKFFLYDIKHSEEDVLIHFNTFNIAHVRNDQIVEKKIELKWMMSVMY